MIIDYSKAFEKHYEKLNIKIQDKIDEAIERFHGNPHDPTLRSHPLKGSMSGKRAFSAGGDLRIIFQEYDDYTLVLMLDVGSHNQVY